LTKVLSSIDTKEASQLYTYAKEMSVSGALEDDAWLEDMSGTADRTLLQPCSLCTALI